MGQYDDRVERQRILIEAEEWAEGVKDLHALDKNRGELEKSKKGEKLAL